MYQLSSSRVIFLLFRIVISSFKDMLLVLFCFFLGGGVFFLRTSFYYIVQCLPVLKMTSKVSFDQRQTTMS